MRFPRTVFLAVLGIALSACSTIDYHRRVEGWPPMRVAVHVLPGEEISKECGLGLSLVMACARYNLTVRTCDVYVPRDGNQALLEHELLHCVGYSHPGDPSMQNAVDQWKLSGADHGTD